MQTQRNPITRRPKSRGRQALDAVLFLAAAALIGWGGLRNVFEGRVAVRRGADVLLADQPDLFWGLTVLYVLILLIFLALGGLAARALLASRDGRP